METVEIFVFPVAIYSHLFVYYSELKIIGKNMFLLYRWGEKQDVTWWDKNPPEV